MSLVHTYYASRLAPASERSALDGKASVETCVIGGGLAGLTTALELARAGRSVIVLEAEHVGFGASGRNGGFVGPAWAQRLDVLIKTLGADRAKQLYRLSQERRRCRDARRRSDKGQALGRPHPVARCIPETS